MRELLSILQQYGAVSEPSLIALYERTYRTTFPPLVLRAALLQGRVRKIADDDPFAGPKLEYVR